ncbi:hypothetical protein DP067_04160 [Mycoplasmopsis anatis]|uniref:Putative lipoprotein n=1 Tax=Mycoplasmopsis anatis 1340 TaxID=1034808 RepID=F9QCK6_9BACT|nr:GDSL-type esterase/lipase family protein [Mycoplasmopsis anatis]AWX70515.1 hypothetical protein DP067_04160 [Mycoplasmopsis anatis]EGS29540.1 putative lipoprotein [Mycoplasmopsis anatis 1340]VEU73820.1 Uncharacterised protein [Mycoplasmopsis anatis]
MKSKKKLIIVSAASSAVGIGAIVGVSTWIATHKPKEIARGGNPINKDDEPGDKKYEIIDSNSGNIIDFDAVFNNKQNVDLPEQRIKSSHFIDKNTKIKYVAIGDSITAGFDGTLEKDYKGSFENGLVTGLSYPSYLSRLFNKINRLESFDNYSVTGSTINEWIDLLQLSTNPKDLVSESSLISRFGKDYKLLAKEIIKQLKESNFITLSIGANDFIHTFIDAIKQSGITQSIQLILNDNPTFGPLIEDVKKILDSSIKEVSRRLQVFASEIKKLAPDANINFISYPTPFLKLKYMIDNFVKNFAGDIAKDFSITDFFTGILNNTIKLNANRNGINFINPVNNQFWNKNAQKISSIWFDIHPNTNGYKKLAIDLFIKLTNPSLIIDDYEKLGDFNFSTDFLKSDYQTASYQIEIENYSQTIKEIIGLSDWEFINKKDKFETDLEALRSTDNFGKRMLRISGSFKKITQGLVTSIVKSDYIKIIDPNGTLQQFLTEDGFRRSEQIVTWLLNSGYLSELISNLQNELTKLVEENPNASIFDEGVITSVITKSFTNEKSVLNLLKSLAKSDFIQQNKNEIREISNNLRDSKLMGILFTKLKSFISPYITKLINNPSFTQEKVYNLLNNSIQQADLENAIIGMINDFLDISDDIDQVNSYYDLFVKIISNGKTIKSLKTPLSKVIEILLSDKEVISLISNKVKDLLNQYDILLNVDEKRFDLLLQSLLNNESIKDLANSLVNVSVDTIINFVRNNHQKYNNITAILIDSIKSMFGSNSLGNINLTQLLVPVFEILNSNVLDNNVDIIETMLHNFIESKKINHADLIISVIPQNVKQILNDFIDISTLKNKVTNIISNQNNKDILVKTITNSIKEKSNFKNKISNVNDALYLIAKGFAKNDKANILKFINSIKDELEIDKSIRKIIENYYRTINLDFTTAQNSKFIDDITAFLSDFIKNDKNIELLIDNLLFAIKNSNNYSSLKENVSNKLISYLKDVLNITEFNFEQILNKILNLSLVKENQNAIKDLLKSTVNFLLKDDNNYLEIFLSTLFGDDKNSNNQFIVTISQKIKTPSFKLVLNKFIDNLLSDNWVEKLNKNPISTIIFNSLKDPKIINEIRNNKSAIISLVELPKIKTLVIDLIISQTKKIGLNKEIFNYEEFAAILFSNLVNNLLKNPTTNNILDLLINSFEKSSNLDNFIDNIKNQLGDEALNLLKWISSSLIKAIKDTNFPVKTTQFVKNIINQLINESSIKTLLDKSNIQAKFKLTKYPELKSFLTNQFTDKDFTKLIDKISSAFVDGITQTNTYSENIIDQLVKNIFSSNKIDQEFINILNTKLESLINNESVQELISKILITKLDQLEYSWIFDNVKNPEFVISKLIKLLGQNNTKLKLSEKLIQTFIAQLSTKGTNLDIKEMLFSLVSQYNFDGESLEKIIVDFVNSLAKDKEINNLSSDIKVIINNIFNKIKTDNKFVSLISTKLFNIFNLKSIFQNQNDFEQLIIEIFNNDNFSVLLNQLVDLFFSNITKLDKANSYEELFKVLFTNFKFVEFGQKIDSLIADLIHSESIKKVIGNIIKKQLIATNSNLTSNQIDKFSKDLANDVPLIFEILGLKNNLFSAIAEDLDKLNKENNLTTFTQILEVIIKKVTSQLTADLRNKLNKLLKIESIQSNKEEFTTLINSFLPIIKDKFINESLYEKIIDIEYAQDKKIGLLIDKNEIYSLLNIIKNDTNFDKLVSILVKKIINNPDILMLNNNKELINTLLFDDNTKQVLSSLIKNLFNNFDITNLRNTLNKLIIRLCKDNNLIHSEEQVNAFTNALLSYLKNNQSKLNINNISNLLIQSINNSNNIDQLISNIQSKLLNLINLKEYGFVKEILNSDFISPLKKFIVDNFEYLYSKFTDNIDIFQKIKSIDISKQLNIQNTNINHNFISVIETLENDPDFKLILKQFIKDSISNIDKFKNANSYYELIINVIKNQDNLSKNSPKIKQIINRLLNNTQFKELFALIIENKVFNNAEFAEIFNGINNKTRFSKNIVEFISTSNKKFNFTQFILDNLVSEISNENFNVNEFATSILNNFKNKYLSNEGDTVEFIKFIFNEKIWTEDKQNVLQIVKNIVNSDLTKVLKIDSLIDSLVKDNQIIDAQSLKSIVKITTGSKEFKNIINKIIDAINTSNLNLENVKTYSQLINEFLKNVDFNLIKKDVKNLINTLLNSDDVKANISSLVQKIIYSFTNVPQSNSITKLSNDIASNLYTIVSYNDLVNKIIDSIFNKLNEIKNNKDFETLISEIPTSILQSVKQSLSNPIDFIRFIFNNPVVTNNYEGLNYIIQNGLENIINIPEINQQILNLSNSIDEKWVDRNEIRNFISKLIKDNRFIQMVKSSASNLLKTNNWINKNKSEEIILEAIKQSKLLNNSGQIVEILKSNLTNDSLILTFNKLTNNLLIDNNIISESQKLSTNLTNSLYQSLISNESFDLINKVLELIKTNITSSTSFEQLFSTIKPKLIEIFKNDYYKLIKNIFSSQVISKNKVEVKNFIHSLLNNYIPNNINSWVDQINLTEYTTKYDFDDHELKSALVDVFNSHHLIDISDYLVDDISARENIYKNTNSLEEFIQTLLWNNQTREKIENSLSLIIKDFISKANIREIIKKVLLKELTGPTIDLFLEGISSKEQLISNIIEIYNDIDSVVNLTKNIISSTTEEIKLNGFKIGISSIISNIFSKIKSDKFNDQNAKETGFKLIKVILNSKLITQNKDDLVKIINNLIKLLSNEESISKILDGLSDSIKNELFKYASKQNLIDIIKFVATNNNFNQIINVVTRDLLENVNTLKQTQNFDDFVAKLLSLVNFEKLKENIKGLINDLITNKDIKVILKNILKQTLISYGATNDSKLELMISDIVDELDVLINDFELINTIIDKSTELLSQAKNSNDPNSILIKIPNEISKIISEKIKENPYQFVENIIQHKSIKNNYDTLIRTIQEVLEHLINNQTIENLIIKQINSIEPTNELFNYANKNDLNELVRFLLHDNDFKNTIKNLVPKLLNNRQWLNNLNNTNELLKSILEINGIVDENKTNISNLVQKLLTNNQFKSIATKSLIYIAKQNDINLNISGINELVSSTLDSIIPILKELNLYDQFVDDMFELIKDPVNLSKSISTFVDKIKNILLNNNFELLKKLLASRIFNDSRNKATLKAIVNELLTKLTTSEKVIKLVKTFGLDKLLQKFNITKDQTNTLSVKLFTNGNKINLVRDVLYNVIDNSSEYSTSTNYNDLIKRIFNRTQIQNSLRTNFSALVKELLNDSEIRNIIAEPINKLLTELESNWLLKNTQNSKSLITELLTVANSINNNLHISDKLIETLISEIKLNGTEINFSNILNSISTSLSKELENNLDQKLTELIKSITNTNIFRNSTNYSDLKVLISNILEYLNKNNTLANVLVNSLNSTTLTEINKYADNTTLKNAINVIINNEHLKNTIFALLDSIKSKSAQISQANNLNQIVKISLEDTSTKNKIKNELKLLVRDIFTNPTIKSILKNVVKHFFDFIGIDSNNIPEANSFMNIIVDDLYNLLNRLELIDNLINPLVDQIGTTNDIIGLFNSISSQVIENLKITEYATFTKLLKDNLVTQNKQTIIKIINHIINKLTTDETKIRRVLEKLDISSLLINGSTSLNKNRINDFIIKILKNQNLKNLLNTLVEEVINNNLEYAKLNTWWELINKILNSSKSNDIKNFIKNWLIETVNNNDIDFELGLGELLVEMLRKSGFNLNQGDKNLFGRVVKNSLKAISSTNEFDQIINKIYDNIKNLRPSSTNPITSEKISDAIIKGVLSIISSDDGSAIQVVKILDKSEFIGKIISQIGSADFVKFIDRLFESSDLRKNTGIYAILKPLLSKNNNSPSSAKVEIGTLNVLSIPDKAKVFLAQFFKPFYEELFKKAINNNLPSFKQDTMEYRNLFRITEIVLWFLWNNNPSGVSYWNTNLLRSTTIEGIVNLAHQKAMWDDLYIPIYKYPIDILRNETTYRKIGFINGKFNTEFVFGSRSNWTKNWNYDSDQLLAYIYYINQGNDRHNTSKTKEQVLWEALEKGYLGTKK